MMGQVLGTVASDKIINVMDEWMDRDAVDRFERVRLSLPLFLSLSLSLTRGRAEARGSTRRTTDGTRVRISSLCPR